LQHTSAKNYLNWLTKVPVMTEVKVRQYADNLQCQNSETRPK